MVEFHSRGIDTTLCTTTEYLEISLQKVLLLWCLSCVGQLEFVLLVSHLCSYLSGRHEKTKEGCSYMWQSLGVQKVTVQS